MANGKDRHDKLIAEAQAKAESLDAGDGYEWVVKTTSRFQGDEGYDSDEKVEDHILKVGTFTTTPARVTISKGLTLNLGNYESCRVTVGIEMPCYVEEATEVAEAINAMVESRLQQEVLDVRGEDVRPGKRETATV
jgi:hypothetical protein